PALLAVDDLDDGEVHVVDFDVDIRLDFVRRLHGDVQGERDLHRLVNLALALRLRRLYGGQLLGAAVGLDGVVEDGPRLAVLALAVQAPGQAQAHAARQQSELSHDRPPNGTQDKGRAAPWRGSGPDRCSL